jgi:TolA-binding protein
MQSNCRSPRSNQQMKIIRYFVLGAIVLSHPSGAADQRAAKEQKYDSSAPVPGSVPGLEMVRGLSDDDGKEMTYHQIQVLLSKGDLPGAYREFLEFRKTYPNDARIKPTCEQILKAYGITNSSNTNSPEIVQPLDPCGDHSDAGAAILWERGEALFAKKDFASAQKYFQRIMLSFPTSPNTPAAAFYNAECYFMQNRNKDAADAYKFYYQNYPNDSHVAEARRKEALYKNSPPK